jgi:vitamin B12 transporter
MGRFSVIVTFVLAVLFLSQPNCDAGNPPGLVAASGDSTNGSSPKRASSAKATPAKKTVAARSKSMATTPKSQSRSAPPRAAQASKLPPMTIVVTASRMPQPIEQVGTTTSVVSAQNIQTQQIQRMPDALREVPGVVVTQSGSPGTIADVSIRGATPEQTLIMIDGVPVNDSATSSFDISRLTTDDVDRVEVVRGAGGSLYGSQAIGGVVNILPREGSGPSTFTMLSEGGNRATERQVLTMSGAQGKLAYSGSLSYFSTEGFRPVNDNSDNLSGSVRLDYHLDENTTFHGFAMYTRANVSLASFSVFSGIPLNPTAHQRNEFMLYKGGMDHYFGKRLRARISAFYVRDDLRLNATPFTGNPSSETDHIPDETRGGNLEAIYTWAKGIRTLVGFDFLDRWVHSQSDIVTFAPPPVSQFFTVFNARRQEYAGYVEQEAQLLNGHLIATGGFRVDGNSEFGEEVSPAWSVAIPLQRYGLTLRGNYAEGFRAPSFDELFFPGFGNPHLGPEISSEYDGGITKTFGEKLSITATYFSRRVHNLIVTVPAPGTPFGAMAGNAGRVDTQGVEFAPTFSPLRGLLMSGNFTFIDQSHVSPEPGEEPTRVPKYAAAATVQYVHSDLLTDRDNMTAAVQYTFVGDRDDITTAGTIANHVAYHRVDLALSYSPGVRLGWILDEQMVAKVENVFDRHYSEAFGFPAPPVNFVAGVKLTF